MTAPFDQLALRHLRVTPLRLVLRLKSEWRGPRLKTLLLRSGLGYHLRQRECLTGAPSCDGCSQAARCWYAAAFDTPAVTHPAKPLHHAEQNRPHPFYLVAAPDERPFLPPGERLPCLLTLFGNQKELAGKILDALAAAGAAGRWGGYFDVESAGSAFGPGPSLVPWRLSPVVPTRRAEIDFVSPLRLRIKGLVQREPAFPEFMRALLRRIHLLVRLYSEVDLPPNWALPLVEGARALDVRHKNWRYMCEARASGRQGRKVAFDGVFGGFIVSGELDGLWPFLDAGQWIGVGSSTSHGFGCFAAQRVSEPQWMESSQAAP
jgi:hypothetical protein